MNDGFPCIANVRGSPELSMTLRVLYNIYHMSIHISGFRYDAVFPQKHAPNVC